MYKLLLKLAFCFPILFVNAQDVKGLYVDGFATILGDVNKEDSLLRFAENNGFNYLTLYQIHVVNNASPLTSVATAQPFAQFINKAKTQFGITQIGIAAENFSFFKNIIAVYNQQHALQTEKVDVYNFEFEFWIPSSVENGAYYCDTYLSPNGMTCDTAGAFQFYKQNLHKIDSLANAHGQISEAYFGFFNLGQGKQIVQTGVDRVLMSIYLPTNNYSASYQYNYVKPRLQNLASAQTTIQVLPLYSSEPSFMQLWTTTNYFFEPFSTLKSSIETANESWKNYIDLKGIQWFDYSDMPKKNMNLSVENIQNEQDLAPIIFPNPSKSSFTIRLQQPNEIAVFSLFDLSGKLLLTDQIQNLERQVSTLGFTKGLYLLKVQQGETEITTKLTFE